MRRVARSAIALFAIAILGLAPIARAAEANERAAAVFRQGQEAFARKNYAAAAAAFEEAAFLSPHPVAWLDAGEAWEKDGSPSRAAEAYDRALAVPGIADAHRREAEARLARITPKIGTLDVRSARTLVMRIDGAGESHVPGTRRVMPGRHELAVIDLAGAPMQTLTVDVAAGETRIVEIAAPAAAAPASPPPEPIARPAIAPPPPPRNGPPTVSVVAFGASAAAVATAAVFGGMTLSARSDFNASPTNETRDRFYHLRTGTNVAWAIAGVTASVGVVTWLFAPSRSAQIGIAVTDSGLRFVHEARF